MSKKEQNAAWQTAVRGKEKKKKRCGTTLQTLESEMMEEEDIIQGGAEFPLQPLEETIVNKGKV